MNSLVNKIALRPKLNLSIASSSEENFQSKVLRPILKLQNDLIIVLFKQALAQQKTILKEQPDLLQTQIRGICQKNTILKHQLIGCTIGLLEIDEISLYLTNQNEFNKRIIQMIAQRLFDNLKEVK